MFFDGNNFDTEFIGKSIGCIFGTRTGRVIKEVQGWQPDSPPPEWTLLRDRWERFHGIRSLLVVSGFTLFAASVVFFDVS